jgi:hypothetical protein
VQLTTDGHRPYLAAVEDAFGQDIDCAMLIKIYGADNNPEKRYSLAVCLGCNTQEVTGAPDPKHISTSYVERQNLTMRMSMRRFTRLTNGFSNKLENHAATVAGVDGNGRPRLGGIPRQKDVPTPQIAPGYIQSRRKEQTRALESAVSNFIDILRINWAERPRLSG